MAQAAHINSLAQGTTPRPSHVPTQSVPLAPSVLPVRLAGQARRPGSSAGLAIGPCNHTHIYCLSARVHTCARRLYWPCHTDHASLGHVTLAVPRWPCRAGRAALAVLAAPRTFRTLMRPHVMPRHAVPVVPRHSTLCRDTQPVRAKYSCSSCLVSGRDATTRPNDTRACSRLYTLPHMCQRPKRVTSMRTHWLLALDRTCLHDHTISGI